MSSHNCSKSVFQCYLIWKIVRNKSNTASVNSHNCSKSICQLYLIWEYRWVLKHYRVFVSFLKFEAFTKIGTLIRWGVPTVQNLLQFTQSFCCIQDIFISAVSSLNLKRYSSFHLNQMRWSISSESTAVYTIVLLYPTYLYFTFVNLEIWSIYCSCHLN